LGYRIFEKNYIIRTLWTLEARIEGFFAVYSLFICVNHVNPFINCVIVLRRSHDSFAWSLFWNFL